jgi:hypothetical protein
MKTERETSLSFHRSFSVLESASGFIKTARYFWANEPGILGITDSCDTDGRINANVVNRQQGISDPRDGCCHIEEK